MASQDKLILYTNHRCPCEHLPVQRYGLGGPGTKLTLAGAHRAHIVLAELGLQYEEVIIDLDKPRTPEYLAVNPRGLVPALSYNGEIIIESGIVAQFLADAHPSHLVPTSDAPGGALRRARIALFVDAYISKFTTPLFGIFRAATDEEAKAIVDKVVVSLVNEVEPQLADASPFFGGSDKLTLAEVRPSPRKKRKKEKEYKEKERKLISILQVLTASFAIRIKGLAAAGIYPAALWTAIEEKAPNFRKWLDAVSVHPSVTYIYDEQAIIEGTKARIAKLKASA